MRLRQKIDEKNSKYKILVVDDEVGVIDSLTVVLGRSGYHIKGTVDPVEAVDILKNEHFDLMVLDYLMAPIHGDEVVRRIREFNKDIYILLLTGHKDLAPPIETIKSLDIQGYCEKSDRFDQLTLLVESGIKSIEQMKTVKHFKDGLNSILEVVPKIHKLQPMDVIMEEVLNEIPGFAQGGNAFIIADNILGDLSNEENEQYFKGIGNFEQINSMKDIRDSILIENVGKAKGSSKIVDLKDGIVFPLLSGIGESAGALYLAGNDISKEAEIIKIYVNQAATAINNALLHNLVNLKNDELSHTYNLLEDRYMDTVEVLRLVVDAKDVYTRGHSDRVSCLSSKIGENKGLSDDKIEILRVGGLFHDVGKVGIPDKILLKTSELTDEEYKVVQKHPAKGTQILSGMAIFRDMLPLIVQHHERIDGKGYPNGLKGDEIDPLARIVAVADAYDAMQSDRTYRSRFSLEQTITQLEHGKGTQFDGEVVETFVKMLDEDPKICCDLVY